MSDSGGVIGQCEHEHAAWHANKATLHAELDAAGVPTFDGEECRIAARVGWLVTEWRLARESFVAAASVARVDSRKLAKAEHDRDRYADRIESLRAENAALRDSRDNLQTYIDAAYVPQHIAMELLAILTVTTGADKPGVPNTLWAMVHSVCRELAELRAKYANNWHDPPQIGDHKWVRQVFHGKALPLPYEYEEGGGDE